MVKQTITLVVIIIALVVQNGVLVAQEEEKHRHEKTQALEKVNKAYDAAWARWQQEFAESKYFLPGMVVGEIGAVKGELAALIAQRVGPNGHVYANEIDEKLVKEIAELCRNRGLDNVTTILGEVADPRFPPDRVYVAVMVEVFHHLEQPEEFMETALRQLKRSARFIIVESQCGQASDMRQCVYIYR